MVTLLSYTSNDIYTLSISRPFRSQFYPISPAYVSRLTFAGTGYRRFVHYLFYLSGQTELWPVCYIMFRGGSAGYGSLASIVIHPTDEAMLTTGVISYAEDDPLAFRFTGNTAGQWGGFFLINLIPADPITYTFTYETPE